MYHPIAIGFELFRHGITEFQFLLEFFRVSVASFSAFIAAIVKLSTTVALIRLHFKFTSLEVVHGLS